MHLNWNINTCLEIFVHSFKLLQSLVKSFSKLIVEKNLSFNFYVCGNVENIYDFYVYCHIASIAQENEP